MLRDADILSGDTSKEAAAKHIEVLRKMGLEGRAKLTFELCDNLREITKAGIRKKRPFSQQEFARRMSANFFGMDACFVTPEDSILSKLEWGKDRQSETQFNDALGVFIAQKDKLDFEYLKKWAKELGVEKALNRLTEEAGK